MTTENPEAFRAMAEAVSSYLETVGWRAVVVGSPRIEQPHGSRALNYEFVLRFTGGKKQDGVRN